MKSSSSLSIGQVSKVYKIHSLTYIVEPRKLELGQLEFLANYS